MCRKCWKGNSETKPKIQDESVPSILKTWISVILTGPHVTKQTEWTRQAFLDYSACVKDYNWWWLPNKRTNKNKKVLNCSFRDAVSMCRWPNYITNYSHRRSVQRCLCAWKCSDRIIVHVCKTSCHHSVLQYPACFALPACFANPYFSWREIATPYLSWGDTASRISHEEI